MYPETRKFEELSFNAHPALNTMYYDGWLLRFAEGYTLRANSVNTIYPSTLALNDKISYCEDIYTQLKLSTVFKITPLSLELDAVLEERGYRIVTPTNLMTATIPQTKAEGLISTTENGISEDWQDNYFRLQQTSDTMMSSAKKLQSNIIARNICSTLACGGEIVACGLCVVERDCAGIYDIITAPQHRRKGYGLDICTSLICAASEFGAKTAYLQVVADNYKAIGLYEKIGFEYAYQYWYRVKEIK